MPRKVKQKQKQKQSQTVVVNIGTRGKRTKQARQSRQPPPTPQYIPYPVPQLRGPEPMVASQPSLAQLLEALRPHIQAPVVAHAPAVPPPIHIPNIPQAVAEGKEEVGPEQVDGADASLVLSAQPLVDAQPRMHSSSSSSSSSGPDHTFESLNALNLKNGPANLIDMATELNIVGRHKMSKSALIHAILRRFPPSRP